ncbi:hypothetical protein MYX07_02760 [Patescibacteria group bacterium AH-259-L07]|nr:hypothetical protein [Patescibacteria group bacterium AH-259-L07]
MFNLSIYTLEKTLFEDEVAIATVPSIDGELGILDHHTALITPLKKGVIKIKKKIKPERYEKEQIQTIEIKKGFLEIKPEEVVILAET